MSDLRPKWARWVDPNHRPLLVMVGIVWFVVGLGLEMTAVVMYGWRFYPLDHWWTVVAWLLFATSFIVNDRVHGRRLP